MVDLQSFCIYPIRKFQFYTSNPWGSYKFEDIIVSRVNLAEDEPGLRPEWEKKSTLVASSPSDGMDVMCLPAWVLSWLSPKWWPAPWNYKLKHSPPPLVVAFGWGTLWQQQTRRHSIACVISSISELMGPWESGLRLGQFSEARPQPRRDGGCTHCQCSVRAESCPRGCNGQAVEIQRKMRHQEKSRGKKSPGPSYSLNMWLKKKRRLAVNFLLSCPDVWVKGKDTWEEAEVARRWFGAAATVPFQARREGCFSQFPSLLLACIFCCLLEFLKTYFVLCVWVLACMHMSLLGLKLQDLYNIFQPHSPLPQLLQAPHPFPTLYALSLFFKPLSTIYIAIYS